MVESIKGLLVRKPGTDASPVKWAESPYPELGRANDNGKTTQRSDVVFISARFRSGSTLLWRLLREIDGVTAYYEPFNERRWFDASARGGHTDPTHRGVSDYWREYEGMDELGQLFRDKWNERHLLMAADFWNPKMKAYIEQLIERAAGRSVLQFNRLDFRLPWVRRTFPRSKIVHLYRNPRDQWCSTLMDITRVPLDADLDQFASRDEYYLMVWARDLKYQLPFLDVDRSWHPYRLFYLIWKMSYLFGVQYADHAVSYENLVESPVDCMTDLYNVIGVNPTNASAAAEAISGARTGRWTEYADDEWFHAHESACEDVITEFLNG